MYTYIFEIKDEHLTLLDNSFVSWNDLENGAPTIDPKYPYGEYQMAKGMAELLNIPFINEDYRELSQEDEEYMWQLHSEMKAVFEIAIHTRLFSKGFYKKEELSKWQRITADEFEFLAQEENTKNVHNLASIGAFF